MISDIRVFGISSGDLIKKINSEGLDEIVIEVDIDIDTTPIGYKVIIAYVDIYFYNGADLYTIASIHKFSCQITETNVLKFTDDDYWSLANSVQGATNQAYVMFMQKTAQSKIQVQPIPIPILNDTYNNLKTGTYSLWN